MHAFGKQSSEEILSQKHPLVSWTAVIASIGVSLLAASLTLLGQPSNILLSERE